jgi:hypothetical protein
MFLLLNHFKFVQIYLNYFLFAVGLLLFVNFIYIKTLCYLFFLQFILLTNINIYIYTGFFDIIYIYMLLLFLFLFICIIPYIIYLSYIYYKIGLYLKENNK